VLDDRLASSALWSIGGRSVMRLKRFFDVVLDGLPMALSGIILLKQSIRV